MKVLVIILTIFITTIANADVASEALNKVSEKISNLIPGEGITELNLGLSDADDNDPTINLLILRNLNKTEDSNLFTQFSLQTQDVGQNDLRYIGNLGMGYRFLNDDRSLMLGGNIFYDRDFENEHERGSIGLEARGGNLEINANFYEDISLQQVANGRKEQALGGYDLNISSQIPYMPWARFNYTSYEWEADIASTNTKGTKYSSEMNITSSLVFDIEYDESGNTGGDDISSFNIRFVYPPRDNKPSLTDGFITKQAFVNENVSSKLSDKVKRNNKIVIETQGAVVFVRK
jgi:hypothetical protein